MIASVKQSSYYDMDGNLLWTEPMYFSRLDGRGDPLVHNGIRYEVGRVAIAGCVQIINLRRMGSKRPNVGKLTDLPTFGYSLPRRGS